MKNIPRTKGSKNGLKVEKIGNFLIINGEYYIPKTLEHGTKSQKLEFKKVKKKEFDLVRKLAKRLAKNINAEQIMVDTLAETNPVVLHNIERDLDSKKKKPKVIQRHGCIDMKIGKTVLSIR